MTAPRTHPGCEPHRLWAIAGVTLLLAACAVRPPADSTTGPMAATTTARAPNIVLILADDLGIGDVGAYGGQVISTPHIDALAATGVRAAEGYVSHSVCSPSRAGLLTGRHQARHGWEFNPFGRDRSGGLSTAEGTIADALKDRGYATSAVGKWDLGRARSHHPMNRGFDEYFGVLAGASVYIDSRTPEAETIAPPNKRGRAPVVRRGFEPVEVTQYLTDAFTDEAVAFIDRHGDEPFFLYLSHTTPHGPLQATRRYLEPYSHIGSSAARIYAAMVGALDESVARVVAKLREIGRYENTLIAFLSDNGCADKPETACSNAPHAGFKRWYHEGGLRIPFILSWPAGLPAGQVYAEPVSSLDLLATFTGAAGKAVTTEDSVNLLPYLRGERDGRPHEHLHWRSGPNTAIRDGRWKLIRYKRAEIASADVDKLRRATKKASGWPTDAPLGHVTMLYDLDADPSETVNLAGDRPEVVIRLMAQHANWVETLPPSPAIMPPVKSKIIEADGEAAQLFF